MRSVCLHASVILQLTWNLSDKSVDFCEKIISTGLYKDFFEYLSSKTFSPENIDNNLKRKAVQGQLGSLHNIVQKAKNAREAFRNCKAVDILQIFREATQHQVNSESGQFTIECYCKSQKPT